jgi:hypothetical protein
LAAAIPPSGLNPIPNGVGRVAEAGIAPSYRPTPLGWAE